MVSNRNLLFQGVIFRCYVSLPEGNCFMGIQTNSNKGRTPTKRWFRNPKQPPFGRIETCKYCNGIFTISTGEFTGISEPSTKNHSTHLSLSFSLTGRLQIRCLPTSSPASSEHRGQRRWVATLMLRWIQELLFRGGKGQGIAGFFAINFAPHRFFTASFSTTTTLAKTQRFVLQKKSWPTKITWVLKKKMGETKPSKPATP